MRLIKKNFLLNIIYKNLLNYPVPENLSYWWNFGVLSGVCLVIQIITGIFLAMHYIPSSELAFASVEHIMRDVNYGWLLRYSHANGASFFFLFVYIHMFRNIYYNSFFNPREIVWCIGVIILLVMIITAFLGYVLPWGQMSFWAATVITSLVTAIPVVGTHVVVWLWGGYSVDSATLNRFFSLHYLLPFVLLFLVILHVLFLHESGSSNPAGFDISEDKKPFYPYFVIKDLFGILVFLQFFIIVVFFYPNVLGHSDNYIPANPLVTPAHIVPEWYFLPFYAILRSVPDKFWGVVLLLLAILILLLIPFFSNYDLLTSIEFSVDTKNIFSRYPQVVFLVKDVPGSEKNLFFKKLFFWFFVSGTITLGWIGGCPIEYPYWELGQMLTFFYFFYFLFLADLSFFFYLTHLYTFFLSLIMRLYAFIWAYHLEVNSFAVLPSDWVYLRKQVGWSKLRAYRRLFKVMGGQYKQTCLYYLFSHPYIIYKVA